MKLKGMNAARFADELGIQRSGMSHLLSGRNKPSLEFVLKVLNRFPEVSADYLLFGKQAEPVAVSAGHEPPEKEVVIAGPQPDLFTQPVPQVEKREKEIRPLKKSSTAKKIEKIVVFYDDRTFGDYMPE